MGSISGSVTLGVIITSSIVCIQYVLIKGKVNETINMADITITRLNPNATPVQKNLQFLFSFLISGYCSSSN